MSAAKGVKDGQHFPHKTGDVVLVKWRDGKIYFAKIKTIEWSKKRCVVIFDDKSQDLARFSWIHDVNETTTDIICVKCKQDCSDKGNEIVLCDQCGYGYHQKCHETKILQRALEDDSSWICYFCEQEMACPYVTNADALAQSLEGIDDQGEKPDKFKFKKRKQSMKVTVETNKKYCTGLLAASPTVEQSGEEVANGEHYMEQSTPLSAKPHKTQSRRKSKPYKVEICSSISKEYFVDDEDDNGETPTSSRGRKIKRKTPLGQDSADNSLKKFCADSSALSESPSGVGIFSFDMPTEFHSNLHQLAVASHLVSQSPSGEVPHSVIKAIEHGQKSQQQERNKSPVNNREKPKSLILSIPRSPLISISSKQSTTTPASSLVQQPVVESSTPCVPAAIPSPVIVSNRTSKTSPLENNTVVSSASAATQTMPGSPDSGESVFTYPNPPTTSSSNNNTVTISQLKSTSTPTIVRVDSVRSFSSSVTPVMSSEPVTKASEQSVVIVSSSSSKPPVITPTSAHPTVTTPVKVTQNGAFFECPPPVTMVTKPTSIQFVDKNGANIKATTMPPKFTEIASSPATVPAIASVTMPTIASVTTPTITAGSPIVMHNPSPSMASVTMPTIASVTTPTITAGSPIVMHSPSPSMARALPTTATPTTHPVYYVQISGGAASQPVLVQPIRQQHQAQSPVVKIVDSPVPTHAHPSNHGDQQASHVTDSRFQKITGYHNKAKETQVMQFANQVKDVGTNISVKMGATYNLVSEYTLISKFEEAWNKLNELTAQWQQPKQTPVVAKKAVMVTTKAVQRPSVSGVREKVVMVAQQQQQPTVQHVLQHQQQPTVQHVLQHQQQQQTLTTPVQLVPISAPHHVATPVVSVLSSPAHVIPSPAHTPNHMISTPVVIPAVARTGSDAVTYYSIPPKAAINPAVTMHPHKSKDEVYMVQVVKPVAPVMPVTPVMSVREKRTAAAQQCDVCSKKASFLCSGCQSAWYCGRSCQYNAWQEHSHRCNKK